MKQFMLMVLLLISVSGFGGEAVNETVEASANGQVTVEVVRGNVNLYVWDKKAVKVEGNLDEETEKFIFKSSSDEVVIKVKLPNDLKNWSAATDQTDIDVYVPVSSSVDFSGVSTDFTVKGIEGGVDGNIISGTTKAESLVGDLGFNSVSGDIFIKGCKGKLRLKSVSGNLSVKKVGGVGKYNTISGDMDINSQQSSILANSISGDIELRLSEVDDLEVSSISGEQDMSLTLKPKANLELRSVSGEVDVVFKGDVNAEFNLRTTAGGDIDNRISKDKAVKNKYGPARNLNFTLGDGSGNVEINTTSGDISLSN